MPSWLECRDHTQNPIHIGYPYAKAPDVLVLMSQDANTQFIPTFAPGGLVLYEEVLAALDAKLPIGSRALAIPATCFAEELGLRLALNIVLVGFFAGVMSLLFTMLPLGFLPEPFPIAPKEQIQFQA
jgi:Pyruvate/2-oxoacid:ferredoxin oxidoreductase gamma subunit